MARNLACQWRKNSWQCAWDARSMRIRRSSACHAVAKILKCSKIIFQGVTTWYEEIVRCTWVNLSVTHFVTCAWHMARHGVSYASLCRLDRHRAAMMARLGTPYCGPLRGQNSCQCETRLTLPISCIAVKFWQLQNSFLNCIANCNHGNKFSPAFNYRKHANHWQSLA